MMILVQPVMMILVQPGGARGAFVGDAGRAARGHRRGGRGRAAPHPYHAVRAGDVAAAVRLPGERGRSAVWLYNEVRNRRVLVALAAAHAWRDFPGRAPGHHLARLDGGYRRDVTGHRRLSAAARRAPRAAR